MSKRHISNQDDMDELEEWQDIDSPPRKRFKAKHGGNIQQEHTCNVEDNNNVNIQLRGVEFISTNVGYTSWKSCTRYTKHENDLICFGYVRIHGINPTDIATVISNFLGLNQPLNVQLKRTKPDFQHCRKDINDAFLRCDDWTTIIINRNIASFESKQFQICIIETDCCRKWSQIQIGVICVPTRKDNAVSQFQSQSQSQSQSQIQEFISIVKSVDNLDCGLDLIPNISWQPFLFRIETYYVSIGTFTTLGVTKSTRAKSTDYNIGPLKKNDRVTIDVHANSNYIFVHDDQDYQDQDKQSDHKEKRGVKVRYGNPWYRITGRDYQCFLAIAARVCDCRGTKPVQFTIDPFVQG